MNVNAETVNMVRDLISSVGFPIVCVVFMWRKITESDEKQTQLLTQLTEAVKSLTDLIKAGNIK